MFDAFFRNWGKGLKGLSSATTVVQSVTLDDKPLPLALASADLAEPAVVVRNLDLTSTTVTTQRIMLSIPPVKTSSISLTSIAPAWLMLDPVPDSQRSPRPQPPRPAQSTTSHAPPTDAPLKDRLGAVLQPPLSVVLADQRLWLPFEPFAYQYEGVSFLSQRWSALLADEMGLGKTMQTILALRLLLRGGLIQSILLVCPKPLVTNWVREFGLWAEEIPVAVISGGAWSRRASWLHNAAPVKLCNYESLSRDDALFDELKLSFDLVILDEAQRIKNRDGKTARFIHSLRRKRSWALTGTPVENRARDLASLIEFVQQQPVEGDDPASLRRQVAPLLLRRTKDMVLEDMPEKRVNDVFIDLGPTQREAYDAAEKEGIVRLNDLGEHITIKHVFELVRRLKGFCNFDPLTGDSAKADQLEADLEEIVESQGKAIVFSQWVTTLEELKRRLARFGPLCYHGSVKHRQRDAVLEQFRDDPKTSVLLLSYGAGAVGLNLQFCSYVFLFDRWWNPAIEDQAINRAHRIGQRNTVMVYRFVSPDTIEERIAQILDQKRELFSSLIDDHAPDLDAGLTRAEVFGLFDLKIRAAA